MLLPLDRGSDWKVRAAGAILRRMETSVRSPRVATALAAVLVLQLAVPTALSAPSPTPVTATDTPNPLLVESDLPFGYPRFDRIRAEHFRPAYDSAMAAELR